MEQPKEIQLRINCSRYVRQPVARPHLIGENQLLSGMPERPGT